MGQFNFKFRNIFRQTPRKDRSQDEDTIVTTPTQVSAMSLTLPRRPKMYKSRSFSILRNFSSLTLHRNDTSSSFMSPVPDEDLLQDNTPETRVSSSSSGSRTLPSEEYLEGEISDSDSLSEILDKFPIPVPYFNCPDPRYCNQPISPNDSLGHALKKSHKRTPTPYPLDDRYCSQRSDFGSHVHALPNGLIHRAELGTSHHQLDRIFAMSPNRGGFRSLTPSDENHQKFRTSPRLPQSPSFSSGESQRSETPSRPSFSPPLTPNRGQYNTNHFRLGWSPSSPSSQSQRNKTVPFPYWSSPISPSSSGHHRTPPPPHPSCPSPPLSDESQFFLAPPTRPFLTSTASSITRSRSRSDGQVIQSSQSSTDLKSSVCNSGGSRNGGKQSQLRISPSVSFDDLRTPVIRGTSPFLQPSSPAPPSSYRSPSPSPSPSVYASQSSLQFTPSPSGLKRALRRSNSKSSMYKLSCPPSPQSPTSHIAGLEHRVRHATLSPRRLGVTHVPNGTVRF